MNSALSVKVFLSTMEVKKADEVVGEWDLVISPKNKWYDIDVKGVWHYRDLIRLFVRRDFVASYKQTIMGPLWLLIQPLISTLVLVVVWSKLAKFSTGGAPPVLFYMSAFIPWVFFTDCVNKISGTFTANAGIFGKVYFPRLVTPVSTMISNSFKFFIQFFLFIIFVTYYYFSNKFTPVFDYHLAFLPLLLLLFGGTGLALGLIISSFTTKYRDISFLVGYFLQMLLYGSSVIFSIQILGPLGQKILSWNPLVWIVEAFRYALLGVGVWSWGGLAYSAASMLLLLFIAVILFNRVEKTFMDTV